MGRDSQGPRRVWVERIRGHTDAGWLNDADPTRSSIRRVCKDTSQDRPERPLTPRLHPVGRLGVEVGSGTRSHRVSRASGLGMASALGPIRSEPAYICVPCGVRRPRVAPQSMPTCRVDSGRSSAVIRCGPIRSPCGQRVQLNDSGNRFPCDVFHMAGAPCEGVLLDTIGFRLRGLR